jgi:hypothetical protein
VPLSPEALVVPEVLRYYTFRAGLLAERTPKKLTSWEASDCTNLAAATEWKREAPD